MSVLALGDVVAKRGRFTEAQALDREGLASLRNFVEPDGQRIADAEAQLERAVREER